MSLNAAAPARVLNLIQAIAEQTILLALNATMRPHAPVTPAAASVLIASSDLTATAETLSRGRHRGRLVLE